LVYDVVNLVKAKVLRVINSITNYNHKNYNKNNNQKYNGKRSN